MRSIWCSSPSSSGTPRPRSEERIALDGRYPALRSRSARRFRRCGTVPWVRATWRRRCSRRHSWGPRSRRRKSAACDWSIGMTDHCRTDRSTDRLCLHRLRIVITPIVSGMAVFIVGLQLGIVGIGEVLDVEHETLPVFPIHLMVTISTVGVCMALSIWGRGVWKLVCSIIGLGFGMTAAVVGRADRPGETGRRGELGLDRTAASVAFRPWFRYRFAAGLYCGRCRRGVSRGRRGDNLLSASTTRRGDIRTWQYP